MKIFGRILENVNVLISMELGILLFKGGGDILIFCFSWEINWEKRVNLYFRSSHLFAVFSLCLYAWLFGVHILYIYITQSSAALH